MSFAAAAVHWKSIYGRLSADTAWWELPGASIMETVTKSETKLLAGIGEGHHFNRNVETLAEEWLYVPSISISPASLNHVPDRIHPGAAGLLRLAAREGSQYPVVGSDNRQTGDQIRTQRSLTP